MTCPTCGQSRPDEQGLTWTIKQIGEDDHAGKVLGKVGWFSVSVMRDSHAGWALRQDLEEAKAKALLRLEYAEDLDNEKENR